jgi:hypothetical protein
MRTIFFTLTFLLLTICLNAQLVLFQEDFETAPVTSIVNDWTGTLPNGPSPCSQASRGTTADFNSSSIDFLNAQNPSYFLGVNPESPCGGFYNATLLSDSMDWSAADSIVFKCKYFMSIGLNWGSSKCEIILSDGVDADTISTEFISTNTWDSISVGIPLSLANPNVVMTINMGGGEGVALDDILILNYPATEIKSQDNVLNAYVYPNPVSNYFYIESREKGLVYELSLMDISGRCIIKNEKIKDKLKQIDINHLLPGVYILYLRTTDGRTFTHKLIKN